MFQNCYPENYYYCLAFWGYMILKKSWSPWGRGRPGERRRWGSRVWWTRWRRWWRSLPWNTKRSHQTERDYEHYVLSIRQQGCEIYRFLPIGYFLWRTSKSIEAVFLVSFGTSSFPAWHEVYGKNIKEFAPSSFPAWLKIGLLITNILGYSRTNQFVDQYKHNEGLFPFSILSLLLQK